MPAGSTYSTIATYTVPSNTSSYTFTSIPGTYTDLVLICSWKNSVGAGYWGQLQFNGDTGSNYSTTVLDGNGTSATSYRYTNDSVGVRIGGTTTANNNPSIVNIMNYANTTTFKTQISRYSDSSRAVQAFVSLWRSTAAINSIKIQIEGGTANIVAGSTFTLYGITAA